MTHWKLILTVLMAAGAALQHTLTGSSPLTPAQWCATAGAVVVAAGAAAMAYMDTTVAGKP